MANSRMRRLTVRQALPNSFAAIDFGNKKIASVIARQNSNNVDIIGGAIQQSRGITDGAVTDMGRLERTIRIVVERAENQAEQRVNAAVLGVSGAHLKTEIQTQKLNISGRAITLQDVKKLTEMAYRKLSLGKNILLTNFCINYKIDESVEVIDPIGMIAETLEAKFSVTSAPSSMVQNLVECCRRAGLRTLKLLPATIASGVGTLTTEEQQEGAVSIDIGALTTSLALFQANKPVWQESIPIGSEHISRDLAHGLGTTLAAAERLKTLHGSALPYAIDDKTPIEVAILGPMGRLQAEMRCKGELQTYIEPRVTELVDLSRRLLFSAMHSQNWLPMRVVVTGGGSQMAGIDSLYQSRLNLPTRIGVPESLATLGSQFETPNTARVAGLVKLAQSPEVMAQHNDSTDLSRRRRTIAKCFRWLVENF